MKLGLCRYVEVFEARSEEMARVKQEAGRQGGGQSGGRGGRGR